MSNLTPLQALNLDSSQQQSFVRYYKSLPDKPNTTIRFFNRVDYYTLHGDDASFAAKEVFKSTAVLKYMGAEPNKLEYLVLSHGNFELFLRNLLLIKLYRVEVYVKGTTKSNDWVLEYKGSPGNLSQFEDLLFSKADVVVNSTIIAVKCRSDDKNKFVGVVCVDSNDHTFWLTEFSDNEHFSELEALVVQIGPKECLLQGDSDLKALTTVMEHSNVSITTRKKSEFTKGDVVQDLNRLLEFAEGQQHDANSFTELNMDLACSALNATIKYLELMSDETNYGKYTFKKLDSMRFVHLDSAAINALNIFPKKEGLLSNSRTHSILGLLDRCRTSHGKRLISQWVRQPLRDVNVIQERLDIVETLVTHSEIRRQLYEDHMRRIPDFQIITKKLVRNKGNLQDCYKLFQAIERIPCLVESLRRCNNKSLTASIINPIADLLIDLERYQQMVESTIDMDLVDRGEFLVKPSFDDNLQELSNKMKEIEKSMQGRLNKAARDLNLDSGKTIKLDSNSLHGYHFRITLKEEPILRKNKSYEILDAIKGGVRFTNSALVELNEEYKQSKESYEDHQKNVVDEIIRIAAGYSSVLWSMSELLAKLDVLLSFSIASCDAPIPYVRPEIVESSKKLKYQNMRHPCLELQEGVSYIANDVDFEEEKCTFCIITGPNMGGKSTYIRSVGVCTLMAHIGCFVPCSSATVPLVDSILARVGADDCQTKGLSTFMLEMIETASILRTATKNSLVIVDELGRGTSTYEGCGIAWAIAEHLANTTKAFCLFATHFHEITQLEQFCSNVTNLHVTAKTHDNLLTLMYEVKPGICDKSFGIHVAKMADFPDNIVKYAEKKQSQLESHRFDLGNIGVQNKMEAKNEAERIIEDFVKACQKIDIDKMSDSDIQSAVLSLKESALENNNLFIKMLLENQNV